MKPDIFVISLGCPRNLVDSEVLIGTLKVKGFQVVYELRAGCVALVNTCGFIEDAKEESVNVILELAALKREGRLASLIVCGCLSQRYPRRLMNEIGEIDAIFGCTTFTKIPEYIYKILNGEKIVMVDKEPSFLYNHSMPRTTMTPRHTVYVKIQEGCMNFCSYCVIPKIRGSYRSRTMESTLNEIRSLQQCGAKEVNLIGQDTTLYGVDRYKNLMLATLLKKASQIMKSGWVRLLYTHPAHYNQRLIDVIKNESPICKYLDLPIQHASDKILKKMNRDITKAGILNLIEKLRKKIPDIAIRTTIMVGFPGENDKDFDELEKFIKEIKFDRLGVFMYSREEDTRAFGFPNQIPHKEKCRRHNRIMEVQKEISRENNKTYLGKTLKILVDEKDQAQPNQYLGRTEYNAPEVDGVVYVRSRKAFQKGDFVNVKIEDVLEYDLVGRVYESRK